MNISLAPERIMPEIDQNEPGYAEHISRYFFAGKIAKDKVILDIACGTGYGSLHLLNNGAKEVCGVDISSETIDYAKNTYQKPGINFCVGAAEQIPFEKNKFDMVVSLETIEHLENPRLFLKELKRVLKKDGVALLSTPNSAVYPPGNPFHKREFTIEEFKNILLEYFQNLKIFYQQNITSAQILSEETLNLDNKEINPAIFKLFKSEKKRAMFVLGLASNHQLPPTAEICTLISERDMLSKQQELDSKQQELDSKQQELNNIYNSRGWKIISFLHKIRIRIPLIKRL